MLEQGHTCPIPQHTEPRGSTLKRSGARHCRTPSEVLSPWFDRSELLWLHNRNFYNIRKVFIMLCLICVLLVSLTHEAVPAFQYGCTVSSASPGWHIHTCKRACCVTSHNLKTIEEIPGDQPLHGESWTGL